jgi:hypothetical protein|tara:strand:- start:851 stop:1051 length:201 start_codon:yes stop_codon:yes gene_type:complete
MQAVVVELLTREIKELVELAVVVMVVVVVQQQMQLQEQQTLEAVEAVVVKIHPHQLVHPAVVVQEL